MATTALMFRQHHSVETIPSSSPLLGELCQEWVLLNLDPDALDEIRIWVEAHNELTGVKTPADIVDHVDASPRPVQDQVLRNLLTLLHAGSQLAGRILLQCMLPALSGQAWHSRPARDTQGFEDTIQEVVAEFWLVAARPRTLQTKIAARLRLDTLHATTRHQRTHDAWEHHTDFADTTDLGDTVFEEDSDLPVYGSHRRHHSQGAEDQAALDRAPYDADRGLEALVSAAQEQCVISADEARLLTEVYLAPHGRGIAGAADRREVSPAVIRQRCKRTRTRLITAVVADRAHDMAGQELVA